MRSPRLLPYRTGSCILVLLLLALAVGGCGTRTGNVSGKVLLQGKPLPGGFVNFMSEGKTSTVKTSEIRSDGSYSVSGVPVGPAKISVQGLTARKLSDLPGQAEKQGKNREKAEQKEVVVPPQYSNAELSGLKYDVTPGSQSHDIELK